MSSITPPSDSSPPAPPAPPASPAPPSMQKSSSANDETNSADPGFLRKGRHQGHVYRSPTGVVMGSNFSPVTNYQHEFQQVTLLLSLLSVTWTQSTELTGLLWGVKVALNEKHLMGSCTEHRARGQVSSQGRPPGIRAWPPWPKWGPLCRAVPAPALPEGLDEAVTGWHCGSVLPLPHLSPSPPLHRDHPWGTYLCTLVSLRACLLETPLYILPHTRHPSLIS